MYPCVWAPKLEACRNSMWFGEMIRDSYNLVFGVHGAVSAPLIFQHQMELFDWNGRCFFWFGKSGLVKSLGVSNVCNSHCNLEINLIVQDNLYTIFLQILQLVTYKPLQPLKQASSIYWYMHATCHGWYMRERERKKKKWRRKLSFKTLLVEGRRWRENGGFSAISSCDWPKGIKVKKILVPIVVKKNSKTFFVNCKTGVAV